MEIQLGSNKYKLLYSLPLINKTTIRKYYDFPVQLFKPHSDKPEDIDDNVVNVLPTIIDKHNPQLSHLIIKVSDMFFKYNKSEVVTINKNNKLFIKMELIGIINPVTKEIMLYND